VRVYWPLRPLTGPPRTPPRMLPARHKEAVPAWQACCYRPRRHTCATGRRRQKRTMSDRRVRRQRQATQARSERLRDRRHNVTVSPIANTVRRTVAALMEEHPRGEAQLRARQQDVRMDAGSTRYLRALARERTNRRRARFRRSEPGSFGRTSLHPAARRRFRPSGRAARPSTRDGHGPPAPLPIPSSISVRVCFRNRQRRNA
jgi:hypothetical protein